MADNVIKKVIDMRKGKTAILPSIVTNPELTGEEGSLKSVEINGKKFTIGGGDGQLKLVATGSYTEYGRFNLSTELDSNKLYYVEYYSDSTGETSNVITRPINMTTIVAANQNDSSGLFSATLTNNEFILNTLLVNDDAPLVYSNDTIKVYELPLTFNEEPNSSINLYRHDLYLDYAGYEEEIEIMVSLNHSKSTELELNEILLCLPQSEYSYLPCMFTHNGDVHYGKIYGNEFGVYVATAEIELALEELERFEYIEDNIVSL